MGMGMETKHVHKSILFNAARGAALAGAIVAASIGTVGIGQAPAAAASKNGGVELTLKQVAGNRVEAIVDAKRSLGEVVLEASMKPSGKFGQFDHDVTSSSRWQGVYSLETLGAKPGTTLYMIAGTVAGSAEAQLQVRMSTTPYIFETGHRGGPIKLTAEIAGTNSLVIYTQASSWTTNPTKLVKGPAQMLTEKAGHGKDTTITVTVDPTSQYLDTAGVSFWAVAPKYGTKSSEETINMPYKDSLPSSQGSSSSSSSSASSSTAGNSGSAIPTGTAPNGAPVYSAPPSSTTTTLPTGSGSLQICTPVPATATGSAVTSACPDFAPFGDEGVTSTGSQSAPYVIGGPTFDYFGRNKYYAFLGRGFMTAEPIPNLASFVQMLTYAGITVTSGTVKDMTNGTQD